MRVTRSPPLVWASAYNRPNYNWLYDHPSVLPTLFIEAWLTTVNIEKMLTISDPVNLANDIQEPRFKSTSGSFIVQFERTAIRKALKQAEGEGETADTIIERVAAKGNTLRFARLTLSLFAAVGFILGVVCATIAFL